MQPSQSTIDYIAKAEGFSPHAYLDPPGNKTGQMSIGFGHQIQPNESHLKTAVWSYEQAYMQLKADVNNVVVQINPYFKRTPTQGVYDGILDLGYNAGPGAAIKVIGTWNATGSALQTAGHAQLYNKSGGSINPNLVARRAHDAALITGASPLVADISDALKKKIPGL